MAKSFSKAFYSSKAWKDCRTGYIASVFNLCERCKQPGYILHHKIILNPDNINDPEITLNWDNLRYLCHICHNIEHGNNDPLREDVRFDEFGNLVKRY